MGQYKVYSEEEKRWITLPMAFQGEQGVKGEPGDDGITPMFKIVSGMWNVSYDNGRTWGEVGPANGTSINDVQAIVDSSTGTPSASASYSGPDNARTLTFRFSGLKGETGPKGDTGAPGKDGVDGKDGIDGQDGIDGSAIEMDPDMVMVNEDEGNAETIIRAYRGNDTVKIQNVSVNEDSDKFADVNILSDDGGYTWKVSVSNITSTSNIVSIKLDIQLVEGVIRHKTFKIYQTKFDVETVSLDFGDDKILVPCANGTTPDAGFLEALKIPVLFRVNGKSAVPTLTTEIDFDTYFAFDGTNLTVKQFPGSNQTETVKFTASVGDKSDIEYITFTKFDTKGGTIVMYSLQVHANDIVCDTTGSENVYTVYTGQVGHPNNVIKATVSKYSSDGNQQLLLSELPSNYRVYYANDPQDKYESVGSVVVEYLQMDDDGIEIGKTISPDNCVSFQLREWIGTGEAWGDMSEDNYKVWDQENIVVDIIRDIASYKFVLTPDKVTLKHDGNLSTDTLTLGVSKNKAGDGNPNYEVLKNIPAGYDIYYSLDGEENWIKVGGESENASLPATIDISAVKEHKKHIVFQMVIDEESSEDNLVVLSETVEIALEIPGKNAYSGYLTDPMGVVSCDAANKPVGGTVLSTTAKVTNGEVTNVTVCSADGNALENSVNFTYTVDKDTVTFTNFQDTLPDVTRLILKVKYKDSEGIELKEGDDLGYTIVKLSIAEASTILDFTNDNIVIPFDANGTRLTDSVTTKVVMMHGGEWLTIEGLVNPDQNGYYDLTIDLTELAWEDGVASYTKTFKGYSEKLREHFELTGQILFSKGVAGKSGKVFDLVLAGNSPIFKADIDKFDDDYIEGWVLVWDADGKATVATYGEIVSAGYQIRYIEANGTGNEAVLQDIDFDGNNHFKIYINADAKQDQGNDKLAYADIDSTNGLSIYFVDSDGIRIRGEQVKVVFDERDFGKFELMMSDESINCVTHSDESHEVVPNKISLLGFYEHIGSNKTQITDPSNIRTHHIAGLDVYYGYDTEVDVLDPDLTMLEQLTDTAKDGYVDNDSISITYDNAAEAEKLNVYLIAHYNDPSISGDDESYRVVDQKEIRIYRTSDGKDADPVQSLVEYSLKANHTYITSDMNVDEIKISVIAKTLGVESSVEEIEVPSKYSLKYYLNGNDQGNTNELTYSTNSMTHGDVLEVKLLDPVSKLIDLVTIEYVETIESRITVVNDNHTDQIYLDGDNKPIDIDKFANDLLAWGSFINVYQGNKSIEFSSEDTDLPTVKNMVWEFYNKEESCVSTQKSYKFEDNEGNHQNDITGLTYDMTVAYSKSNKMHLMYHLWKNYFDAEFDWSKISYILIKTDILYKGDTYPIITKLVVTSGSDDIDLYVSPLMYAYKNGTCKGWSGDEDSVYVSLYLNNKQVWMEGISEIPEGYALRYGFVGEHGNEYSKTYNTGSTYEYLKFSETGGKTNPYVRFVEFGKIDSDDSFDVLDRQEIRPLLDGTPAQHLEIDNNFQLIYVDKDGNASADQVIEANVFLVEGGKKVDNASITKETSIGDFSSGKFTHTINKGNSCKELPTKITFKCNDLIANLHINTTLSPGDIEDLIDDKVNNLEVNGARGRMLYPAGVWNERTTYEVTANAAPYVQYAEDSKYYILKSENDIKVSGSDKNPFNTEYWEPMETFSSVFTEAIVAQYGNIGGAVYYSHTTSDNNTYEFLFSKSGKENDTIESAEYSDFMIDVETDDKGANKVVDWTGEQKLLDVILERSRFIPNTLICFTTGEAWYSGGSTKFYADSSSVAGMSYVDEEQLTIPKTFTFTVTEEETKENGDGDITIIPGIRVLFECTNIEQSINNRPAYIYTCSAIGNYDSIHVWYNSGVDGELPDKSNGTININDAELVLYVNNLDCSGISINNQLHYDSGIPLDERQCYIRHKSVGTDFKYWINVESNNDPVVAKKCTIKGSSAASMHISGDLTVEGKIYGQLENYESSDERKKTFENSINVDFDKLALLRKSYFTYNEKPSVQKIGVSAQEIQRLYPEIVGTDPRGYLGVDYSKLSVIALKAIDQLHERVKYLEGVIESLSK